MKSITLFFNPTRSAFWLIRLISSLSDLLSSLILICYCVILSVFSLFLPLFPSSQLWQAASKRLCVFPFGCVSEPWRTFVALILLAIGLFLTFSALMRPLIMSMHREPHFKLPFAINGDFWSFGPLLPSTFPDVASILQSLPASSPATQPRLSNWLSIALIIAFLCFSRSLFPASIQLWLGVSPFGRFIGFGWLWFGRSFTPFWLVQLFFVAVWFWLGWFRLSFLPIQSASLSKYRWRALTPHSSFSLYSTAPFPKPVFLRSDVTSINTILPFFTSLTALFPTSYHTLLFNPAIPVTILVPFLPPISRMRSGFSVEFVDFWAF